MSGGGSSQECGDLVGLSPDGSFGTTYIRQIARSDCTCILGNPHCRIGPVNREPNRRPNINDLVPIAVRVALWPGLWRQMSAGDQLNFARLTSSSCQPTGMLAQLSPTISTSRAPLLDHSQDTGGTSNFQLTERAFSLACSRQTLYFAHDTNITI